MTNMIGFATNQQQGRSRQSAQAHLALLALLAIEPDILQLLAASIHADSQTPASLQSTKHMST